MRVSGGNMCAVSEYEELTHTISIIAILVSLPGRPQHNV